MTNDLVIADRREDGPARFSYEDYSLDPATGLLECHYRLGPRRFTEAVRFDPGGDWASPVAAAAARWVFLLAGVSYYKTAAPPVVDLGDVATTGDERRFLTAFYRMGLAEFAYRNRLDLGGLELTGPPLGPRRSTRYAPRPGRPLVPFGGGIDSVVTADEVARRFPDTALFVVSRPGDRFAAIEAPAAATGLPVVRAERALDPQVLRSSELGFLNGHVPVTGIVSAIAVMAAVLDGRDAVVMSNERSASDPNLFAAGVAVNHQYSKSLEFERGFRWVLAPAVGPRLQFFSLLRPCSELWVAERFARLAPYHHHFCSCNAAFTIDPARRSASWCGRCDKCCFIDLVLAPFLTPDELSAVFGGHEPLTEPALADRFRTLVGLSPEDKPFECVGDLDECRAAMVLAAARPDRAASALVQSLAAELRAHVDLPDAEALRSPQGEHCIPAEYGIPDEYEVDGIPDEHGVDDARAPQDRLG
jgi:hypothetical protein